MFGRINFQTIAIVFDGTVGVLSFEFLFNKVTKIFGFIKFFSDSTTKYIRYFLPDGYQFKKDQSKIMLYKLDRKVVCLKKPEIISKQLSKNIYKLDDRIVSKEACFCFGDLHLMDSISAL